MLIDGKSYDREMPGFGQILSDAQAASLLSYVRREFASSGQVTAETVSRIRSADQGRTGYWSVQDLLAQP